MKRRAVKLSLSAAARSGPRWRLDLGSARHLLHHRGKPNRQIADPQGQNLTHRTLEHFYCFWGLSKGEIRAARVMPAGYPIGEILAYGDLMSPVLARAGRSRSRSRPLLQNNDRMPQYQMEQVLRARLTHAAERRDDARLDHKDIAQDREGVRVTIARDGEQVLEGDYVVGCDGGHSLVRRRLGVGDAA